MQLFTLFLLSGIDPSLGTGAGMCEEPRGAQDLLSRSLWEGWWDLRSLTEPSRRYRMLRPLRGAEQRGSFLHVVLWAFLKRDSIQPHGGRFLLYRAGFNSPLDFIEECG